MNDNKEAVTLFGLIAYRKQCWVDYASSYAVNKKSKQLQFNSDSAYRVIQDKQVILNTYDASQAVDLYNSLP